MVDSFSSVAVIWLGTVSTMITVHYLNNSRAHRLVWLLEEMQQPYDLKTYRRSADFLAPPELTAVHPLGKSPVITDGGAAIAESGAIFEYLLGRYDPKNLVPQVSSVHWPDYLYFLHSAEGSAMPILLNKLTFGEVRKRAPWFVRPIAAAIADNLTAVLVNRTLPALMDYWEAALRRADWFAGEFSAADIMMSFPVQGAASRADALTGRPRLADWLQRIGERPAYSRAIKRGDFKPF
jgi:glutathione S-transferase